MKEEPRTTLGFLLSTKHKRLTFPGTITAGRGGLSQRREADGEKTTCSAWMGQIYIGSYI